MGITDIEKGCKNKARALRSFAERRGLALSEVSFMGDDVNDVEAMEIAGYAAAPANAMPAALGKAAFVSQRSGGNGAVRELIEAILAVRDRRMTSIGTMIKLSDYVIRFIADQGVKHVFLVTGGGAMHLNESLSRCPEIRAGVQLPRAGERNRRRGIRQGHEQSGRGPA